MRAFQAHDLRYLAATTGCNVVGVELQADLCEAAADLTSRVHDLSKRVQFIQGNGADLRSMRMPAEVTGFVRWLWDM